MRLIETAALVKEFFQKLKNERYSSPCRSYLIPIRDDWKFHFQLSWTRLLKRRKKVFRRSVFGSIEDSNVFVVTLLRYRVYW